MKEQPMTFSVSVDVDGTVHEATYSVSSKVVSVQSHEDSRVFETAWKGGEVAGWTARPLFLTADPTLIAKWAELQSDLAAQQARAAIARASGRAS